MDLLLKLVHRVLKIPDDLGVHGIAAPLSLGPQGGERLLPQFPQFLFSCRDVELKLPEVGQVFLIHGVQHANVFEHLHPGLLQLALDPVHLDFQLLVLHEEFLHLGLRLLKKAHDPALFLQGAEIQSLHIGDEPGHQLSHISCVLCADVIQDILGEIRDVLLRPGAVLHQHLGVRQVDLLLQLLHLAPLLRRE